MKSWIDQDFLLHNQTAVELFHTCAESMPIIDFHNHLDIGEISNNRSFANLTELWLERDHYKWRAMRALGIDEQYITGDAPDLEKFKRWAYTVERLPGNPLYHWTHLELQRYFGIGEPLCENNAERIFAQTERMLADGDYGAAALLERMRVRVICTTEEPTADLETHAAFNRSGRSLRALPSYRADGLIVSDMPDFGHGIRAFGARFEVEIDSLETLFKAVDRSLRYFADNGCVVSDHSLSVFKYTDQDCTDAVLQTLLCGRAVDETDRVAYSSTILRHLVRRYAEMGFVMQLHLGAKRANSPFIAESLGPDSGGDSIGNPVDVHAVSALLGYAERNGVLPKTILFGLNPGDNTVLATLAASFARDIPGKVQLGSAWWFLDNLRGIRTQLDDLMETGLFASFVGMLTDSRSLTSFSRHEYFRRILCNRLGELVESGEYANTDGILSEIVQDICYRNAARFFCVEGRERQ